MEFFGHELRLAWAVLLNAAVWGCAYRFARRRGNAGALQAACDAFLLYYIVQYAAVGLPGVFGALNVWTMSAVAVAGTALMLFGAGRTKRPIPLPWSRGQLALLGCGLFVAGYIAALAHVNRWDPPRVTDALVYHLPAAVQWLQTGRLGLFPTWYWNPANTWSPMTGSTFMAWLIAPVGNDVLVRFVQGPALLFVFLVVARLCRLLGCGPATAGLLAAAAVVSRPLFSQVGFPKDDLFVTAFFLAAVVSMARENLLDRLSPWRVGVAVGMLLAMKYTVVLVCPLLLFLIDAPFRAKWRARHWILAAAVALLLAGPWYLRNAVLTGNPFYPLDVNVLGVRVFTGLFSTTRAEAVRDAAGVVRVLFRDQYHSLPLTLAVTLLVGCVASITAAGRTALRDPPRRAVLIGTPLTLASFFVTLPNEEVRFAFPLFALLFAAAAPALARCGRPAAVAVVLAAALLVFSMASFAAQDLWHKVAGLALPAAVLAGLAVGAWAAQVHYLRLRAQSLAIAGIFGALGVGMFVYVEWAAYLDAYYLKGTEEPEGIPGRYAEAYGPQASLWEFVRENVPDDATVAVANTYFVYPFYDARFRRRIVYAPVRADLPDYPRLPRLGDAIPADLLAQRATEVMNSNADRNAWLENLRRSGAQYLVISRFELERNPPEARFIDEGRGPFREMFADPLAGGVYRVESLGVSAQN